MEEGLFEKKTLENEKQRRIMWTWINKQKTLNTKRHRSSLAWKHRWTLFLKENECDHKGYKERWFGQENLEDLKLEISFIQTVLYAFSLKMQVPNPMTVFIEHPQWQGFVQLCLTKHQCKSHSKHGQRIVRPTINQAFHSFFPGVRSVMSNKLKSVILLLSPEESIIK